MAPLSLEYTSTRVINLIIHSFLKCIYYHMIAKKSTRIYQAFTNASNSRIREDPKKSRGKRDAGLVGQSMGEGRKEGRKARWYQRGGGNPAGFNHRPTRRLDRRGSPSAFLSLLWPLLPHAEEVSKLLSSVGVAAGRTRPRGLARECKRQAVLCGSGLSRTHRRVAIDISREASSR